MVPHVYVATIGIDRALRVEFSSGDYSDARCAVSFLNALVSLI